MMNLIAFLLQIISLIRCGARYQAVKIYQSSVLVAFSHTAIQSPENSMNVWIFGEDLADILMYNAFYPSMGTPSNQKDLMPPFKMALEYIHTRQWLM